MTVRPSREGAAGRDRRSERAGPAHAAEFTIDLAADLSPALRALFEAPLREALRGRSGPCAVKLERGRREGEVVARITAAGRASELPLYFPNAPALHPEDVLRIVRSVLEGMGPSAP